MLFPILLQFISSLLHGSCSVFAFGVLWFLCFFLHAKTGIFDLFFRNLQTFHFKTHVFGRSFNFCTDLALNLRLRVVALPGSVTMSRLAETTKKLNRSGHDFLILVLQSSTNWIWMLFSFLLQFISSCLNGSCSVFALGVLWFLCFLLHAKTGFFDFFGLKFPNCFPVKIHIFGRSLNFCADRAFNLRLHVIETTKKVEQVRSWLLGSSLAKFQQF